MSLLGTGALAIWHNLADDFRTEFVEWHNREHLPERLEVPGFRCGRRFHAVEGGPEYFNLYETDDVGVLSSATYLERLNHPTPWTRRVVPGFRDVARSICRVEFSAGVGQGGVMLTQRFAVAETDCARVSDALVSRILPEIAARAGITGAHLCRADTAASAVKTAEALARGTPTAIPAWMVLLEGVRAAPAKSGAETIASALASAAPGARIDTAVYQLETCRRREPDR